MWKTLKDENSNSKENSLNREAKMMLKHFLLVWLLAGLLSSCYSCGDAGDGGPGGDGALSDSGSPGRNGGPGGNAIGRKRTYEAKRRLFSSVSRRLTSTKMA